MDSNATIFANRIFAACPPSYPSRCLPQSSASLTECRLTWLMPRTVRLSLDERPKELVSPLRAAHRIDRAPVTMRKSKCASQWSPRLWSSLDTWVKGTKQHNTCSITFSPQTLDGTSKNHVKPSAWWWNLHSWCLNMARSQLQPA